MKGLIPLLLLALAACPAPGPLKADRDPDDLFGPSEDNVVVIDAILIVDAPLPPMDLRRTAAPGTPYAREEAALNNAEVTLSSGGATFVYLPDPSVPGRYLPPTDAPPIAPDTEYALRVVPENGLEVRAITQTPSRIHIAELALMDENIAAELRQLSLFSDGAVYSAPANQLEYAVGVLEIRLQQPGRAAAYQFGIENLESASPLLIESDFFDEEGESRDRDETSALVRLDGTALFMPWEGVFYAGRHRVKLFAVDRNWFDLVRTDNIGANRETGEAGQGFQRPLFHIENGIGLFASAAVDSFGFFIRRKGAPPCAGCNCWGCGDTSTWSGQLDTETGAGRLRFERDVGTGATCELSFEIAAAIETEPCADCAFAVEFELGKVTVYVDGGACDEARELQGNRWRLGQGRAVIADQGGTPSFELYAEADDMWAQVERGWSSIVARNERADLWLFGFTSD